MLVLPILTLGTLLVRSSHESNSWEYLKSSVALACFKKALSWIPVAPSPAFLLPTNCGAAAFIFLWLKCAPGSRSSLSACSVSYLVSILSSPHQPPPQVGTLVPYPKPYSISWQAFSSIYLYSCYCYTHLFFFLSHSKAVLVSFIYYVLSTLWFWQKAMLRPLNFILIFGKEVLKCRQKLTPKSIIFW